jgi:hypothetical protein
MSKNSLSIIDGGIQMNKVILNLFFSCSFFFLISPVLLAQPTGKSLLEAWEAMQKSDPKTVLFEKLAENHYRFKKFRLSPFFFVKLKEMIV